MQFTTPIAIKPSRLRVGHSTPLLLLGSCFADSMGARLRADKFDCVANPFGTLYNPLSIADHIGRCLDGRRYAEDCAEVVADAARGVAFSWMHHGRFSAPTAAELVARMNAAQEAAARRLLAPGAVVAVTLGTAYAYRLRATGAVVANCHKQPDALFARERLPASAIAAVWRDTIRRLRAANPGAAVVMTVSPVRHRRDGLHANQLGKAELLLAVDALEREGLCEYFPAYELLTDELRDYRFYADDMVHPSPLAEDYIYGRLTDTFVPPGEQKLTRRCRAVRAALAHRPSDPAGAATRQLAGRALAQIEDINKAHPGMDWSAERSLCNTRLRK